MVEEAVVVAGFGEEPEVEGEAAEEESENVSIWLAAQR